MIITIFLQRFSAPLHIPLGHPVCDAEWYGVPLGFIERVPVGIELGPNTCQTDVARFFNYFVNGLLNVLIFFIPLRLLHDKFLHRKPKLPK